MAGMPAGWHFDEVAGNAFFRTLSLPANLIVQQQRRTGQTLLPSSNKHSL
jgi:hypothetical protein